MRTMDRFALPMGLTLLLTACTYTGTGSGQMSVAGSPEQPVEFAWNSTDGGITGTMTASIPGATFEGRFFEITRQTRGEVLEPLWSHWRRGWNDWPYWGYPWSQPYPTTQFITHYSGKVVASLVSGNGQHMRCRFHLAEPARGMRGGGQGECQLSGDHSIRAVFSAK